ncbi:hypothetical protein SDC9_211777 [bioreactor metagenome]|uniref:Uncharacterized protein n=1 Tax=bioreactor metagenome TaxID=1076179 RepID=A0A645JK10_9ZZZZ
MFAPFVIKRYRFRGILAPNRPVRRANNLDRNSFQLYNSFLDHIAVLTHYIRIIPKHLTLVSSFKIDLIIKYSPIQSSKRSKCITGEQYLVSHIICHHCLRPMYPRCHYKFQFVITQIQLLIITYLNELIWLQLVVCL